MTGRELLHEVVDGISPWVLCSASEGSDDDYDLFEAMELARVHLESRSMTELIRSAFPCSLAG